MEEARSDFEAANKLAQSAEDAASKAWELVNELADRRTTLKSAIDEARNRLAKLEAELIGLTRDADAAESGKKLAVRAAAQQRRAADQAQRRVDRLS